jgi:hypothetical protein
LAASPTADDSTIAVQFGVPPLRPESAHLNRAPGILPDHISISEHRRPDHRALTPADIAVGCDGHRMYLAAPNLGERLDVVGFTAVNLHLHTPPLARLLLEISRAQNTVVTQFDRGTAGAMPFLPSLRYGNVIVSAARWRLAASDLSPADSSGTAFAEAFHQRRRDLRLPEHVRLRDGDRRLALDLALR